jgi:hypothetical protein
MDFCHISAKIGPMIPSKAHFGTDHGLVWCYPLYCTPRELKIDNEKKKCLRTNPN